MKPRIDPRIEKLAAERVEPCEGVGPLTIEEASAMLSDLPGWILRDGLIEKDFRFKSYRAGLDFAYSIGRIAEEQDHHPDMELKWRRVRVTWATHAIKGLSRNDLIMAAKSELEYSRLRDS